jgi:hypothetical protein
MNDHPKRKFVLLGLAAVILAAAVVLYIVRMPRPELEIGTSYTVLGVCLETKKEFEVEASFREVAPFKNPETGRATVYTWWFCNQCKYRFVPAPQAAPPHRLPIAASCPHCQSGNTCSWGKGMPEMDAPAGDCPLPPMPN